jgi:hypothetical protein
MRKRSRETPPSVTAQDTPIPSRLRPQIRAAAAVMGFTERQIVESGIILFCTYVLNRFQPAFDQLREQGKEVPNWQSKDVVSALASSFVSTRTRPAKLRGLQRDSAKKSAITSVASVLRTLAGEKPRLGNAGAPPRP